MDKDAVNDVILAVGEACNNGILYGAPRTDRILSITCGVSGQCDSHAGALEIDVRNHGNSFAQDMDWSEHTMPVAELMAEHGRGLPLMRSAVDHVCIISDGGDTIVRLVKHLSN
jgi:anti-sigma regulatory factor (Ser/Thr protein kinase)